MKTSFTNDLVNRGRNHAWQTTKHAEEISRKWQSNEPRRRLNLHKVFLKKHSKYNTHVKSVI
jgi:hypothetical protein